MNLMMLFKKENSLNTPIVLNICIIIQMLLLLSNLPKMLVSNTNLPIIPITFLSLQILSLVAIWQLRKWGVVAFIVLIALGFIMALPVVGFRPIAFLALCLFSGIAIVPSLFFWKEMT